MQLRFQASGIEGYERIIGDDSGLKYFCEFGLLRLSDSGVFEGDTGPNEAMLHIVQGTCMVKADRQLFEHLGERATPFDGRPTAIYIPPGTSYSVEGAGLEMVISQASAHPEGKVTIVTPSDVNPMSVGKDNWQRTVTMIAPPDSFPQALIVGETLNPPGHWSGVPAHKHDQVDAPHESVQEEIYYFRFQRTNDWGILRIYDNSRLDEMLLLRDRVVTWIPRGYHTVAAAPGCNMFYTFHLAGPQKRLAVTEDPNQAWIKQVGAGLAPA